eukprot:5160566-Amphidinium_carterae.1
MAVVAGRASALRALRFIPYFSTCLAQEMDVTPPLCCKCLSATLGFAVAGCCWAAALLMSWGSARHAGCCCCWAGMPLMLLDAAVPLMLVVVEA